jgi:glycosyltransferase involved in cell wall biosynthesis
MTRLGSFPEGFDHAEPSLLQRVPAAPTHHEWMLPLMPLSWRLRAPVTGVEAVVSSSHACAKAVRVVAGTPHLCYCHTPMRYAWDFQTEKARFPHSVQGIAQVMMAAFRRWDRNSADNVTRFVANSSAVADRIALHYGRKAAVIHPPVDTEFFRPETTVEPREEFLYVGRLVSYKRADLAVDSFAGSRHRLAVVGEGHLKPELMARAGSNVRFLGKVDDHELRALYRRAKAMVFPADEDFGISMVEAQACGTPVISISRGGALDTIRPGVTGLLAAPDDIEDLRGAIGRAAGATWDSSAIRANAERFSTSIFRMRMREAIEEMIVDPTPR